MSTPPVPAAAPSSPGGAAPLHRRALLGGLTSVAATPTWATPRPPAGPAFLAIGDWGRFGSPGQRGVAHGMAVAAAELSSRFVISTGDNFYPGGVQSVSDPHWRRSFEEVYAAPALQVPWYASLGNHDYRGDPQAQVAYTRHSRRWRLPSRYFQVSGVQHGLPDLDLFVLDTSPLVDAANPDERFQQLCRGHWWRETAEPQITWLRRALERSRARWKVVVGHHPIYSGSHGDSPILIAKVAPLLEAYGVQAYVNGHDHDLQHIRRGRVDFVCSGAGSEVGHVVAVPGTRFCAARPGFAAFRLDAGALTLEFRNQDGCVVYRAALPPRAA